MYDWVSMLYSRNWYNIVNQPHFNFFNYFFLKKEKIYDYRMSLEIQFYMGWLEKASLRGSNGRELLWMSRE